MRRSAWLLGVVVAIALVSTGLGEASDPEIVWQTTDWGGLERMYGTYVPAEIASPAPLVFLLHGGGGSAQRTWDQEHGRSWKALADEHGFVLALPEGRADLGDADAHRWNDCRTDLEDEAMASSEDDVGFITHLMGTISALMPIDPNRIYATGASNGGMMTYRLAIEIGDQLAAVAAIIANLPVPSECASSAAPIPILIMNGTDDPLMPFDGGCVANARCERGRVASTAETVAFWVNVNDAATEPTVEKLPNRAWFDGSTVTVYTFAGGPSGADVVYYHIAGGGHTVPGFETTSLVHRAVAGFKNRDIDGPAEIWGFFREH